MIIPGILTDNFEVFKAQALSFSFAPLLQIDIMDGEFVPNKSFSEIEKINALNLKSKLELHLMVNHPLKEIEKWKNVKKIIRVIFHVECKDGVQDTINAIKEQGWQVGIAINPDTHRYALLPYLKQIDEILFMTIQPGAQGNPFIPEVQDNIIEVHKLLSAMDHKPKIAVDGAINAENIAEVKSWGVENFCVGSAITRSANPKQTYEELNELI